MTKINKITLTILLISFSSCAFSDFFNPVNDVRRFARRREHNPTNDSDNRFENNNFKGNIENKNSSENDEIVFYVDIDNKKQGPFKMTAIKNKINNKEIDKNTLVWTEGMTNWEKAGDVTQLDPIFNAIPPPLPSSSPPALP